MGRPDDDVVDLGDAPRPDRLEELAKLEEVRRILVAVVVLVGIFIALGGVAALVEVVWDARSEAVYITPERVYPGGRR